MGKKKKRGKSKVSNDFEEANEEMLALQSIYDEEFCPTDIGNGFTITIVPHPGDVASNRCSIDLEIR